MTTELTGIATGFPGYAALIVTVGVLAWRCTHALQSAAYARARFRYPSSSATTRSAAACAMRP